MALGPLLLSFVLASSALVHKKLESDFSARAAQSTSETNREEITLLYAPRGFVCGQSDFLVIISKAASYCKVAAHLLHLSMQ